MGRHYFCDRPLNICVRLKEHLLPRVDPIIKIIAARFRREALAGEQLVYDVELVHLRAEGASVTGQVYAVAPAAPITDVLENPLAERPAPKVDSWPIESCSSI